MQVQEKTIKSYSSMMSHTEETLQRFLCHIVEKDFPRGSTAKTKAITSDAANYTSKLFEVTVTTPDGNVEIFAKVTLMGADPNVQLMFLKEKFILQTLSSTFEKFQDEHGISEHKFIFPKFYGYNKAEGEDIIIMENLVAKGYEVLDRHGNINWPYASKSIEMLAKFHALSLALRKQRPDEFQKIEESLPADPSAEGEWSGLTDAAFAAVEGEDREKVARCLEGNVGWSKLQDLCTPLRTAVFVHGDYKPGNLMYKESEDEFQVIPVDYQTVRLGSPVSDLVYFIVTGSDHKFRQQHFHQLIEHYYEQLVAALKRLGVEAEEVYGREEYDSDLKEKFPIGVAVAALALPFMVVAAEHAPSFTDGVSEFKTPRSALFAERFRALVQDFKQWGII